MAFRIYTHKTKAGQGWRLVWEVYENGKQVRKTIKRNEYRENGFLPSMSIEEAKDQANSLNKQESLQKREAQKQKIKTELDKKDRIKSSHLPTAYVNKFEKRVLLDRLAVGDKNRLHDRKFLTRWRKAKEVIVAVNEPLSEWYEYAQSFYREFINRKLSLDYSLRILALINEWGSFYAKKTGQAFLPIPKPRGQAKQKIVDTYFEKAGSKFTSAPLTPQMLDSAQSKISPSQYNWLYLSVWLGLRPNEIDALAHGNRFKLSIMNKGKPNEVPVLSIYQSKLVSVPEEKRWKPIPLLLEPQLRALHLIFHEELKKPLVKTIRKHISEDVSLYGGRKGFTDLMLKYGFSLEMISQWMGHTTIDRTWKTYKDRDQVLLPNFEITDNVRPIRKRRAKSS